MNTYVLTPGGIRRLHRRLLGVHAAYQAICADNPDAAESGDSSVWHDNFAFEENQRQMHRLARQLRDLQELVRSATVVPVPRRTPDRVVVGTRVIYRVIGEASEQSCWIAGWDDGEPAAGRVSYNSPLGKALIGAEVGDERELRLERAERQVEVLDILAVALEEDACADA